MKTIDLVLPFALPPPELARDLLRQARLPALATLVAKGSVNWHHADPYARQLPHQDWLLRHADLKVAGNGVAAAAMTALGLGPIEGKWFLLHPVNLHIARDHLVLTDLRQLELEPHESKDLFDAALPLFEEAGRELLYGSETHWFIRSDDWSLLETSSPDSAVGHNIDIWMPRGAGDRSWRKLLNEVQMMWHTLETNHRREMQGRRTVNALWCWDASPAAQAAGASYDYEVSVLDAFLPVAPEGGPAPRFEQLVSGGERGLVVINSMTPAALAGDWGAWIAAMEAAEQDWFAPLLAALGDGSVHKAGLVLTDSERLARCECSRIALKKFWAKPSLQRLAGGAS